MLQTLRKSSWKGHSSLMRAPFFSACLHRPCVEKSGGSASRAAVASASPTKPAASGGGKGKSGRVLVLRPQATPCPLRISYRPLPSKSSGRLCRLTTIAVPTLSTRMPRRSFSSSARSSPKSAEGAHVRGHGRPRPRSAGRGHGPAGRQSVAVD